LFLSFVPIFTLAEEAQASWDNLKQLRPGQKIEVDQAIALQQGKTEVTVQRADVVRVSVRDTSHRTRNMLLGAGILGGIAIAATAVPLVASGNEGNSCAACAAAIAAGFGGGAALGMIPGNRTIYRVKK